MPHPGEIRKAEAEEYKLLKQQNLEEGPITLLVSYALDIVGQIGNLFMSSVSSFHNSGHKFIYDAVYKDGDKLISSAEKYGKMINLMPFRIILTIMYPPLGVFLSRGVYGLHYALIAMGLTYFNILFGICFAMVINFIPNYGTRFEKYDYYRLLTIKQLIKNCYGDITNDSSKLLPVLIFISFVILFFGFIYLAFRFL